MAPWLMVAAMALQKKREKEEKERARKNALSELHQRRAGELGYPTYAPEAQRRARGINEMHDDSEDQFMQQWLDGEQQKASERRARQG